MLPLEFILTDAHFAIGLLAAMACFATAWLYFDAWTTKRELKELLKWLGCGILAVGFIVTATEVEPSFLGKTLFAHIGTIGMVLRGLGYVLLAIGLVMDPLQPIPKLTGLNEEDDPFAKVANEKAATRAAEATGEGIGADAAEKSIAGSADRESMVRPGADADSARPAEPQMPVRPDEGGASSPVKVSVVPSAPAKQLPAGFVLGLPALQALLPVAVGAVAFLYWRRATTGLERHLKPVGWAFVWLTGYEVLSLAALWRGTADPRVYDVVAPFGPLWIISHVLLAVGATVLGMWVWQYLVKRVQTQLFMVLTVACLVIFLVTTVSFTFLLMSRVQQQTFTGLETTAKVLQTSISAQQAKTVADAEVVAQNQAVAAAVVAKDHVKLVQLLGNTLAAKQQSSLMVTTDSAQVLLRAEDPSRWGDSVSSDSLVARAGVGKSTSGLVADEGALSPRLTMRATTPIRNAAGAIVGTVTVGSTVDNAFVDGLKQSTGLAAAIYSGPVRVATTLLAPDGHTRSVGVRETRSDITNRVLTDNKMWTGLTTTNGQSYLAVYAPLRDADNAPVGMMFIGQPQVLLLQAAGSSIELTFLISVLLLLIAIWPVSVISRSLARQLH